MTSTTADAADISTASVSALSQPVCDPAALDRRTTAIILCAPIAITVICLAMCVPPTGRRYYDWLISENKPVETATFLLAIAAAAISALLAIALFRRRQPVGGAFYLLFALGMFFIGMEEISWGQQLFGWKTPQNWGQVNAQGETTLHNLGPLQGKNDILRFGFGLGGLVGIALASLLPLPRLRILFPHRVLLTWFLIIAGVSAAQVYVDLAPNGPLVGPLTRLGRLAEVVELLISIAAVLYLWLNVRALTASTRR
jgi:hypothetical protein